MDYRLAYAMDLVEKYQPFMCANWKITVKLAVLDRPAATAMIDTELYEHAAIITLSSDIKKNEVARAVLHELAHLVMYDFNHMATTLMNYVVDDELPSPGDRAFNELFEDCLEQTVEVIAASILRKR